MEGHGANDLSWLSRVAPAFEPGVSGGTPEGRNFGLLLSDGVDPQEGLFFPDLFPAVDQRGEIIDPEHEVPVALPAVGTGAYLGLGETVSTGLEVASKIRVAEGYPYGGIVDLPPDGGVDAGFQIATPPGTEQPGQARPFLMPDGAFRGYGFVEMTEEI